MKDLFDILIIDDSVELTSLKKTDSALRSLRIEKLLSGSARKERLDLP